MAGAAEMGGRTFFPNNAARFALATIAGLGLVGIYFWQIFVTMPHLVRYEGDTGGYLEAGPFRGPAVYYFIKSALWFWNDFYAVAVAQGILLALIAALMAYAVGRVTHSALLALAPLLICLFRPSLIEATQMLSVTSLFNTACIGLMACALLLFEKASPWRVGCFLLFGFFVCFFRTIGEVILCLLVFVLALRLWPERRRVLAVLAAGSVSIHVLVTGISYLKYGIYVPQEQAGWVAINGAAFVADEDDPGADYPHDFAAATAPMRAEYERAPGWVQKYQVLNRYTGSRIQNLAINALTRGSYSFDRERYDQFDHSYGARAAWVIMTNEVFQRASLTIIRRSPLQYMKMALVNLAAGVHMFTSYSDYPLEKSYGPERPDEMTLIAKNYVAVFTPPELLPLIDKSLDDWDRASLDLKADIARPLRAFFSLGDMLTNEFTRSPLNNLATLGGTLNWLFIIMSALVLLLAAKRLLRRQPIDDRLGVLLLLIVPTWGYLVVLCLLVRPDGIYMDVTSPFVYIALFIGVSTMITAAAEKLWRAAVKKPWINEPATRGSTAQLP